MNVLETSSILMPSAWAGTGKDPTSSPDPARFRSVATLMSGAHPPALCAAVIALEHGEDPRPVGRIPVGKLVLDPGAFREPMEEVAPHRLAAPGVHVQHVVDDLWTRRSFIADTAHPGCHFVAGAVFWAEGQQANGMDEVDEAVRALQRRRPPELVERAHDDRRVRSPQPDVLDRDDLQPTPDLVF